MQKIIHLVMVVLTMFASINTCAANDSDQVINGLNEFAFNLYHQLELGDKNAVLSPYSVSSSLAILTNGSKGNTYTQLMQVLQLQTIKNDNIINIELDKLNTNLIGSNRCQGWLKCTFNKILKKFG